MSWLRRQGAVSAWTKHVTYMAEVSSEAPLQSIVKGHATQGGGDRVVLGPYQYFILDTLTVKSGVTIYGIPGKTEIIKIVSSADKSVAGDFNDGDLGPVVALEGNARLVDCKVDLVLPTGYSFRRDSDTLVTPSDATGTATSRADDNSVVVLNGTRARMEGCYIPEGDRRGVVVKADDGILLGNEIEHDQTKLNASIYINDAVNNTLVNGNWTNSASTAGAISYLGSTTQWISGNLANILVR
jgi:hypothetical protein